MSEVGGERELWWQHVKLFTAKFLVKIPFGWGSSPRWEMSHGEPHGTGISPWTSPWISPGISPSLLSPPLLPPPTPAPAAAFWECSQFPIFSSFRKVKSFSIQLLLSHKAEQGRRGFSFFLPCHGSLFTKEQA